MQGDYSVSMNGEEIGRVQVQKEGLYYRFFCRCKPKTQAITKLWASCGSKKVSLGILVPTENGFGLEARIPVSRLGQGILSFTVESKQPERPQGRFCPIYPDEPFAYLAQLKNAFLVYQDGQKGILLPD